MRREAHASVAESESPHLFPPVRRRHRIYRGLRTDRQERIFTWISVVIVLLYVTGWISVIHTTLAEQREIALEARETGAKIAAPVMTPPRVATSILQPDAPTTAYINDAMLGFLNPLRGRSGNVFFTTVAPGAPIAGGAPAGAKSVLTGASDKVASDFVAPDQPGVYKMAVQINQAVRQLDNFSVITLVPFSEKQGGRIGTYYLGSWPFERGGTPKTPAYANPAGFIEVTQENADTPISAHFKLRDFLTKDQPNVWPKYLLLNPKLLDKLELTIQELEASGHPVRHFRIMSGFRTPEYNHGGGNTQGRANLSRHMYGDASDTFVDNDQNGAMDDLNGDGRVDVRDAEVVLQAVERVERKNPSLVGGVGVYSACCGHGPFTHIDVRGYRARWRGTGSG